MIEARIFVDTLDPARRVLNRLGAQSCGSYEIIDAVYRRRDHSVDLGDDFLRLRQTPQTIWDEKQFVLVVKQTQLQRIGKQAAIPVRHEFDTLEAMVAWYQDNLADKYEHDFTFHRTGEQFNLPDGEQVDLEINEQWPTIEFKATTTDGLAELLRQFSIDEEQLIAGPSVVAMRQLLKTDAGHMLGV